MHEDFGHSEQEAKLCLPVAKRRSRCSPTLTFTTAPKTAVRIAAIPQRSSQKFLRKMHANSASEFDDNLLPSASSSDEFSCKFLRRIATEIHAKVRTGQRVSSQADGKRVSLGSKVREISAPIKSLG